MRYLPGGSQKYYHLNLNYIFLESSECDKASKQRVFFYGENQSREADGFTVT